MAYRAFIDGNFSGPEFTYRADAEAYIAGHYKIDLDKIDSEESPRRDYFERRNWEVSDNSGEDENILGRVVEV